MDLDEKDYEVVDRSSGSEKGSLAALVSTVMNFRFSLCVGLFE
jgi:hypothetical protein